MIRPILRYGAQLLHQPATDVERFDGDFQHLIDDIEIGKTGTPLSRSSRTVFA